MSELAGSAVFSPLLILDPPKSGSENMAIDESLLDLTTERNIPVLRFYYWNEPTLSLGYFQKETERKEYTASGNIPVVRRKSGGGAILHDKELTYCLAVPPGHPFAKNHRLVLYEQFHRCIISVLAEFGIKCFLFSDWKKDNNCSVHTDDKEFLCFKRFADGDVAAVYNGELVKLAGSAQYRNKNGAVLQHGSILWDRSEAVPELPGILQLLENTGDSLTLEIFRCRIIEKVLHQLR